MILVPVLARHGEVALGLHDDVDDRTVRGSLEAMQKMKFDSLPALVNMVARLGLETALAA